MQTIDVWPDKGLPTLPPGMRVTSFITDDYQPNTAAMHWIAEHAPSVDPIPRTIVLDDVQFDVTHLDLRVFADYSGGPTAVEMPSELRVFGYFRIDGKEYQFFGSGVTVMWNSDTGVPLIQVFGPIAYFTEEEEQDDEGSGDSRGSFVGRRRRRGAGS